MREDEKKAEPGDDLTGRAAVVTGAGRGVGRAVARAVALGLAQAGVRVGLVARSVAQLEQTARLISDVGCTAVVWPADLGDPGQLAALPGRAVAVLGSIDILINNAAVVTPLGSSDLADPATWAAAIQINVVAPAILSFAVLPGMRERGWGRIVNVSSSIAAHPGAMVGMNAYATSKAALEAHTLNLAAELIDTGVTVNAFRPGSVDTAMQGWIREQDPDQIGVALHARFTTSYQHPNPHLPAGLGAGAAGPVHGRNDRASLGRRGRQLNRVRPKPPQSDDRTPPGVNMSTITRPTPATSGLVQDASTQAEPTTADLHFYFDPVCPFAWMTSKWVRMVAEQRDYTVDWRFISLRQLNAHLDYDSTGHTAGLRLLRVAAKTRREHGRAAVGDLYTALGTQIFDNPSAAEDDTHGAYRGTEEFLAPILTRLGLPHDVLAALDQESWDVQIQAETDEALALTGKDVGTPILHFHPAQGVAFFGPVISRLPSPEQAGPLWDHVIGLASFGGFAELKRSLRERPQLASFGQDTRSA